MSVNYPVGDFLIQIKNASLAGKSEIEVAKTKLVKSLALVLKEEAVLEKVQEKGERLLITIAKRKKGPVVLGIKIISRPGLRIYKDSSYLRSRKARSFLILSTPKGVMTSRSAIKANIGGEVIAEVW